MLFTLKVEVKQDKKTHLKKNNWHKIMILKSFTLYIFGSDIVWRMQLIIIKGKTFLTDL